MAEGMTTTTTSGDVEFAQMIPHHERAVEMADVALENDTASQDDQGAGRPDQGSPGSRDPDHEGVARPVGASESSGQMDHGGMMSDDDMSSLMGASGPEFNQMWLTMMIEHHEGAVEMAQDV